MKLNACDIDVAIIGAGTAGLSARSEVAKVTDKYVVIDAGPLGTTCARVGCMPSKALIQSANSFHRRHDFDSLGISGGEGLTIDTKRVMREMRKLRDHFASHVIADMEKWRENHFIEGQAAFEKDGALCVNGEKLSPQRTIIATGSAPIVPGEWQKKFGDRILTTDSFFELETLPGRMAVIGMGPVGAELGQALARLGVEIFAFDNGKSIGGLTDPDLQKLAFKKLSDEFSIINEQAELSEGDDDQIIVEWDGGSEPVDCVLVAAGRKPNLDKLGLENLGMALNDKGVPLFDRATLRIQESDLYIAGDVNGELPVLHEGSDEGRMAGYNAARREDVRFARRTKTLITFTDPEIALIGQNYQTLKDDGADFVIGEASFENQGCAQLSRRTGGCVRIYAARENGRLLGAEMFAPAAEHFVHMLTRGLEMGINTDEALKMPFYHPVFEEGVRSALRDAVRKTKLDCSEIEAMRCADPPVEEDISPG